VDVIDIDEVVDGDHLTIMLQPLSELKLHSSSAEKQHDEPGSNTG